MWPQADRGEPTCPPGSVRGDAAGRSTGGATGRPAETCRRSVGTGGCLECPSRRALGATATPVWAGDRSGAMRRTLRPGRSVSDLSSHGFDASQ